MNNQRCPICGSTLIPPSLAIGGDWLPFDCPTCGRYRLSGSLEAEHPKRWEQPERSRAVLSHAVRKMQRPREWPLLTTTLVTAVLEANDLPSPIEGVDLLLELVGSRQGAPGGRAEIMLEHDRALVGAQSAEGVMWLIQSLAASGLAELDAVLGPRQHVFLTLDGWKRFQELRLGRSESRRAFMAMPYGEPELENLYRETLKPAVTRTGFTLVRLDENPPAGLIDVRLRAELRRSQFLVAELTNKNPGAYWEAGFMEGLGKPVIYLCREDVFKAGSTHFDTNHSHHILWASDRPADCAVELVATIRATLPMHARMED